MNLKVRKNFAVAAVGALACSFAFAQSASATAQTTSDTGANIVTTVGPYNGRIAGADRFGTAVAASQAYNSVNAGSARGDTVLLANANSWTDALAATPLADVLNASVLYTNPNALESKTSAELSRLKGLGVTNVILLGGEAVISPAVETALVKMGFSVDRIGGANRYATAELLAAETVSYYQGTLNLKADRAKLSQLTAAEQAYQDALVAWTNARDAVASASAADVAAHQALSDATSAYAALTAQLVSVPKSVTVDGGVYYSDKLQAYENQLVKYQTEKSNLVAVGSYLAGQQQAGVATWADLPAQISVTVSDPTNSTSTSTITSPADLAAWLGNQGVTVMSTESLADVQTALTDAENALNPQIAKWGDVVGAVIQLINEDVANANLNASLQAQILAAYQTVQSDQAKSDAADKALTEALANEAAAQQAVVTAAENRPTVTDWSTAKNQYQQDLSTDIAAGKAYPAFLATGQNFPDALASGPAASEESGVVLLTDGSTMPAETAQYLANGAKEVAVGGPAAAAAPKASVKYVGKDRYETAADLASAYFQFQAQYGDLGGYGHYLGLASGENFPDAVVGGALLANVDGPIVLTKTDSLPAVTAQFLASYGSGIAGFTTPKLVILGGPSAISNAVQYDAVHALGN